MCTQYLMGVALYLKAMVLLRLVAKTNGTTFPSDATLKPPTTICVQAIEDDDGAVEERSSDQASLKLLMTHPELRKRQVVSKRIDIYISISLYLYSGVYNNAYHDIYTYQFICRPCWACSRTLSRTLVNTLVLVGCTTYYPISITVGTAVLWVYADVYKYILYIYTHICFIQHGRRNYIHRPWLLPGSLALYCILALRLLDLPWQTIGMQISAGKLWQSFLVPY